jgi:hypothetical protein
VELDVGSGIGDDQSQIEDNKDVPRKHLPSEDRNPWSNNQTSIGGVSGSVSDGESMKKV